MKISNRFLLMILVLLNSFLLSDKSYANWAYDFVVWNGYIYKVSDVYVQEIEKEIGEVTYYSDDESSRHRGNFSNVYQKGTKYYSIKGTKTEEAIAIEDSNGQYIKATKEGKYGVRPIFDGYFDGQQGIIKIFILSLMVVMVVVHFIYRGNKVKLGK